MSQSDREEYFDHQLAMHEEKLRPAGMTKVGKMLTVLASSMSLSDGKVPPRDVIIKYCEQLQKYPVDLLDLAMNEYLKKTTYHKFPLIGELVSEIEDMYNARKMDVIHTKKIQRDWNNPIKVDGSAPRRVASNGPKQISEFLHRSDFADATQGEE